MLSEQHTEKRILRTESEDVCRWKGLAERSRFFGQPISEMNRDELPVVVGQLIEAKEAAVKRGIDEQEFWYSLSRAKSHY